MKARIKWVQDATFLGESGSGHAVVMDGPPDYGGRNLGVRPMEMLLLGLGGCASFDVVLILNRSRQAISDCVAEIEAERAAQHQHLDPGQVQVALADVVEQATRGGHQDIHAAPQLGDLGVDLRWGRRGLRPVE